MKKALRLTIIGKVQNVGFRYYTHKKAQELGVQGFVKNQLDGSVYVEVMGKEELVDQFVIWLHQGPKWARVDQLKIQDIPPIHDKDFSVK